MRTFAVSYTNEIYVNSIMTSDTFEGLEALPGTVDGQLLIAGPCSAETESRVLDTAVALARGGIKVFRAGVWKPRTMPGSFEGVGPEALKWLSKVNRDTGMLTATEVATASHVEQALNAGVDFLWLGARTVANPFAVQEIADSIAASGCNPAVLVKNPVSPDIDLWIGALQRLYRAGIRKLGAIHRGFTGYSGVGPYRNSPHWSIPYELRRRLPQLPLICDPSHIAGRRDLVGEIARRAVGSGFDGLIVECHCCPEKALSDAAQQLTPAALLELLATLKPSQKMAPDGSLEEMRQQLDVIDAEITDLLAQRMDLAAQIGIYKKDRGMTAVQPVRYTEMFDRRVAAGSAKGLGEDFLRSLWSAVHAESVRRQLDEMKG